MLDTLVNGIDRGIRALSETFSGPVGSYCRLETVDNGALVADDGSLITVDRSLVPRDGDAVVVDVNGERSIKIFRVAAGRSRLTFGNRRYPEYDPGPGAEIEIFGVITNTVRRLRR